MKLVPYEYYKKELIMDNSVFFRHYEATVQGLVNGMQCINDDHSFMHPFLNFETGKVYFECLECDYRIKPGLLTLDSMRRELNEAMEKVLQEDES